MKSQNRDTVIQGIYKGLKNCRVQLAYCFLDIYISGITIPFYGNLHLNAQYNVIIRYLRRAGHINGVSMAETENPINPITKKFSIKVEMDILMPICDHQHFPSKSTQVLHRATVQTTRPRYHPSSTALTVNGASQKPRIQDIPGQGVLLVNV